MTSLVTANEISTQSSSTNDNNNSKKLPAPAELKKPLLQYQKKSSLPSLPLYFSNIKKKMTLKILITSDVHTNIEAIVLLTHWMAEKRIVVDFILVPGDIADMKNVGSGRGAGSTAGAIFLKRFIKNSAGISFVSGIMPFIAETTILSLKLSWSNDSNTESKNAEGVAKIRTSEFSTTDFKSVDSSNLATSNSAERMYFGLCLCIFMCSIDFSFRIHQLILLKFSESIFTMAVAQLPPPITPNF